MLRCETDPTSKATLYRKLAKVANIKSYRTHFTCLDSSQ